MNSPLFIFALFMIFVVLTLTEEAVVSPNNLIKDPKISSHVNKVVLPDENKKVKPQLPVISDPIPIDHNPNPNSVNVRDPIAKHPEIGVKVPVKAVPVVDVPVKDIPVIDAPKKDIPVVNVPVKEVPVKNIPVIDAPVKAVPVIKVPVKAVPVVDVPVKGIPVIKVPVKAVPVVDVPVKDKPVIKVPVKSVPVVDVPVKDAPVIKVPVKAVPVVDVPVKDTPMIKVPVKAVPVVDVPVKDTPVVEVPVENKPKPVSNPPPSSPLHLPWLSITINGKDLSSMQMFSIVSGIFLAVLLFMACMMYKVGQWSALMFSKGKGGIYTHVDVTDGLSTASSAEDLV